ncbi:MAG: hypothetical protein IJ055_07505, partial [Oscillospiraceae bacterium]|nr:hypothetical protein [Oscillospiraceae bacterium]
SPPETQPPAPAEERPVTVIAPETPAPESPAPEVPTPETPVPEAPAPEAPAPETVPPETAAPEPVAVSEPYTAQAIFLGVSDWGRIHKSGADAFTYRFDVNGQEQTFRLSTGEAQGFALQNRLKETYHFDVTVDGGTVTDVQETETDLPSYTPPVSGTPGERTLRNFLKLSMEPVGTTLYIYGGGWDWQDTGSAIHARSIGVSPDWVRFFREHDANFTYRDQYGNTMNPDPPNSYYPYGEFNEYYYAGLDCSGYVGWAAYNVLNTADGGEGYVGKATGMAKRFADYGWGDWTHSVPLPDGTPETAMCPGDIMSMSGHVWISLGTCADGSVVIAHSTPSDSFAGQPGGGVQISAIGYSESCEAYSLASYYMNTYFPDWCARYPVSLKSPGSYLSAYGDTAGRFRWNDATLSDPDGIRSMSAADAMALIFG